MQELISKLNVAELLYTIKIVKSISGSFSAYITNIPTGARTVTGVGNSQFQAMENLISKLRKSIIAYEEEQEEDEVLKQRVHKELFTSTRGYVQTSDFTEIVTALVKKIVAEKTTPKIDLAKIKRDWNFDFKATCNCIFATTVNEPKDHAQHCDVYQHWVLAEAKRIESARMH